ncbi:hypothetical protein [Dyadobacter sp. 3J3]|uniref:hypothetical protein n=1 Tax=Dyadobacter sp. 3J3 TaxID=2606600 RepID=UPI0013572209|nr:hypothetical protein [Dyadobacter sp. 3J3]
MIAFPWIEIRGYHVGRTYGTFSKTMLISFPWIEIHGYDVGRTYGTFRKLD